MNSMAAIKAYDTIKDANGQRYRITEVSESLGVCKARKVTLDDKVVKNGRERTIMISDINGRKYTRINLPPVQVSHQEPRPDLVIRPSKPKPESVEELFIKDEKAPQIEKDEPSKDEAEKSIEGGQSDMHERINKKIADETQDLEVVRAELKEKLQECVEHKKTISKMHFALQEEREARAMLEQNAQDSNDKIGFLEERNGELEDVNRRFSQDNARLLAENLELKKKLKDANMAKGAAVYITQDELEILTDYLDLAFEEPEDKNHAKMHVIAALDVILTLARGRMKP